jgi:hypothetical protein
VLSRRPIGWARRHGRRHRRRCLGPRARSRAPRRSGTAAAPPAAPAAPPCARGIGRGLVEKLLARPGNTVVATGRSGAEAGARLADLAARHPARLVVSELDVGSPESVSEWAGALKEKHGIKHVDVSAAFEKGRGRGISRGQGAG